MPAMRIDNEARSWWLFLTCAVFFVGGSIRAGDMVFLTGSLLFLAGCVVFIAGRGR